MGLPLFVAPVESDIPSNLGDKSATSRQARSSIRRSRRNLQDSRPVRRRAALLRDNFPTPGPESILHPRYPWIESGHPPPPEAYVAPPPRTTPPGDGDRPAPSAERSELQEAIHELRNRAPSGDPQRQLLSLFGERWLIENLPRPSRRANASPPPQDADDDATSFWHEAARSSNEDLRELYHFSTDRRRWNRRQVDRLSMPAPPVADRFDRSPDHIPLARLASRTSRGESRSSRPALSRRRPRRYGHPNENPTTDGLGDRNRSLSPDEDGVWDTLLTTLTPDPQPPSAGSSFASASGSTSQSQSATASSRTSLTRPENPTEDSFEQPCESGVENSDSDGQEDIHMGRSWDHWTMNYPSRHRRFVANLDSNDPIRISYLRADGSTAEQEMHRRLAANMDSNVPAANQPHRRANWPTSERGNFYEFTPHDPAPVPELQDHIVRDSSEEARGTATQGEADADMVRNSYRRADRSNVMVAFHRRHELARPYRMATRDATPLSELQDHVVRDSSEEARGTVARGEADAETALSSRNHTPNDNALRGMQIIVRNLARREDIPDEWWAGAGLSRSPPEES